MELKIQKPAIWQLSHKQVGGAQIRLEYGEVHRLKPLPHGIQVISGCAWISWQGQDIILDRGEKILFSHGSDDPVISATGRMALIFEMLP